MEYILVSVPATPSRADAKKVLNNGTSQRDLSTNATFSIPQLRVGTLDSLVALTDDLARTDQFVENVTKKIANYMGELLSADKKQLVEHLVLGDNSATPDAYIRGFEWDTARYNVQLSIRELSDTIAQQMTHVDQEMKGRVTAYSKVKGSLQAIERKATGSLLVRSLAGLVDSRFFVKDSEYMTTLLVVVPRAAYKVWERSYESLNEYVVPRSSELVTEDAEYGLFTVTVFRKMVEDFKQTARENKFIVREYEFDAESDAAGEVEKAALKTDIMKKYVGTFFFFLLFSVFFFLFLLFSSFSFLFCLLACMHCI